MDAPRSHDAFAVEQPLSAAFFQGQTRTVAKDLLGTLLLVETEAGPVGGIVVETEAYINAVDPACHLYKGRTPRTEPFFSGAGTLYVYRIHGHHALNVITEYEGHPEGILFRAIEPTHGLDRMRERRGFDDPRKLCSGPGKLTEALGVTKAEFNDRPIADTRLSLYETDLDPDVEVSSRVGVTSAEDWPLRFTVADSEFISQPVPSDESLDYEAVEACYERLETDDAPTTEGP